MNASVLLAAALLVPVAMLVLCLSAPMRAHAVSILPFAPLPALLAAIIVDDGTSLVLPPFLLGLTLTLDKPGAVLLGAASLLWFVGGLYARAYLRSSSESASFSIWWLITLTGSLGVFIAADLVGFYLFYTLVSLGAYGLVAHDGTPAARRAAGLYVALALLGEAILLVGFVLLAAAAPSGSLLIGDVVSALPDSPWRDAALTFLVLGFGLKIGLVPLHIWMPSTYSAAPVPAAAALSGAAVKAGIIGLIRFLPLDSALPGWGEALAALGLFSAFYGVAVGVTQTNAKVVLAYSSVSQMGFLAAVLGMGLAVGDKTVAHEAAFYAVHHMLVKGGLFFAVGVAASQTLRRSQLVLLPAAVLALSLAGLPLTSGHLAKAVVKDVFGDGILSVLAQLSAVGSAFLMLHFLRCLHRGTVQDTTGPPLDAHTLAPWLIAAFGSLAVPWMLYPSIGGVPLSQMLSLYALGSALWPILAGGLLMALTWNASLPRIPAGDLLAIGERIVPLARHLGAAIERIDLALRQWPVAGVCAVLLVLLTAIALTVV